MIIRLGSRGDASDPRSGIPTKPLRLSLHECHHDRGVTPRDSAPLTTGRPAAPAQQEAAGQDRSSRPGCSYAVTSGPLGLPAGTERQTRSVSTSARWLNSVPNLRRQTPSRRSSSVPQGRCHGQGPISSSWASGTNQGMDMPDSRCRTSTRFKKRAIQDFASRPARRNGE
jgi:hypothetical protein